MCSKVDVQSLRHQLEALGVYRPKISAPKLSTGATSACADAVQEAGGGGDSADMEPDYTASVATKEFIITTTNCSG
jgi:hypothetical protein